MGVYIKCMEMPKEDVKSITIFPDGNVRIWGSDIDHDEWAEAIEVSTPHGRLIDADALDIRRREQQAWQDYEHNPDNEYIEGVKDGLHEASKQLSTAMTIIEKEDNK